MKAQITVNGEKDEQLMDEISLRQQFKINAMHGHDVGIWVCEGSGLSLSPTLFLQALCPNPEPRSLLVKWKATSVPPPAFRKESALPLVYGECGRLPAWPYHLHLFAPQAPVAEAVNQQSNLQDWSWAVPLVGVILIYDRKHDGPPGPFSSINRLFDRSGSQHALAPLAWVQAQQLPYLIAALGYQGTPDALQSFRKRYGIAADVPVIPGPTLFDAHQQKQDEDSNGPLSYVFRGQKLALDREYAEKIMDALLQKVERERAV